MINLYKWFKWLRKKTKNFKLGYPNFAQHKQGHTRPLLVDSEFVDGFTRSTHFQKQHNNKTSSSRGEKLQPATFSPGFAESGARNMSLLRGRRITSARPGVTFCTENYGS